MTANLTVSRVIDTALTDTLPWPLNVDTRYGFMFPVSLVVATLAQMCGIGGAALYTPLFVLLFPVLGSRYALHSTAQAVASALLTEACSFASGLWAYARMGCIDYALGWRFLRCALPVALLGALLSGHLAERVLRGLYGLMMVALSVSLWRRLHHEREERGAVATAADGRVGAATWSSARPTRALPLVHPHAGDKRSGPASEAACSVTMTDGASGKHSGSSVHAKTALPLGTTGVAMTAAGALLTGLLGIGIGEAVVPQLLSRHRVPHSVAAGTSVFVVLVTAAVAASAQVYTLSRQWREQQLTSAVPSTGVPWPLVQYTVPGVIVGGQLGPRLQSWMVRDAAKMQRLLAAVFLTLGVLVGVTSVVHRNVQ
ncbi:hypothetical protein CDCA_CDCA20G4757 [Cyanidium caldarium]|uniref:Membrane transporter protein n=1 Tax=Cyanidium caldarium TaxID=2771 RepID=A0AAV9J2E9_CYACA|nr:hypothetical protein CDCA_CDCA20G4757 [Cyanidium caldarium]